MLGILARLAWGGFALVALGLAVLAG